MKRPLIVILFLFLLQHAFSSPLLQKGFPFIKNFDLSALSSDLQNWMTVQAPNGFIYVANSSSLFEFDGVNWNSYTLPNQSALRSLATDSTGKIYVGGTREFGYFYPNNQGRLEYYSLASRLDTIDFESVWRILHTSEGIYFVTGRKHIYKYKNNKLSIIVAPPVLQEYRASAVNDVIYFYDVNAGFGRVQNDTMLIYKNALLPENYTAYFFMEGQNKKILTGIRQQGLFFFDHQCDTYSWNESLNLTKENIKQQQLTNPDFNNVVKPVNKKLNRFLKKSVLYFGVIYGEKYLLTTLKNGLIVTDCNFNVINNFRKNAGLSNDAVYHVNFDKHGGLWLAGEMGLSYIRYKHPFIYYNKLNGINGIVITVKSFRDEIFVGTTQGLYVINKKQESINTLHDVREISSAYIYSMDMEAMSEYPELMIMSSLRDILVYDADREKIFPLISLYGTYDVQGVPFAKNVYLIGHTRGVEAYKIFKTANGHIDYRKLDFLNDFSENVRNLTFDKQGRLWIATAYNGMFSVSTDQNLSVQNIQKHGKQQGVLHNNGNITYCTNDTLFLATPEGVRYYNQKTRKFAAYGKLYNHPIFDSVQINAVLPAKNKIWYGLDQGAMYFDLKKSEIENSVFTRLDAFGTEDIDQDSKGNIWLSGRNNLIAIDTTYLFNQHRKVPLYFREIIFGKDSTMRNPEIRKYKSSNLQLGEIPFDFNSLKLKLACPAYQTIEDISFTHKLEGLDEQWSEWKNRKTLNYSYLPGGTYQLVVKVRDANKKVIGRATLSFTIAPPYYLTTAAIIVYIIVGLLIIYVVILLNSKRLKAEKQRLQQRIDEAVSTVQQQKEELEVQAQHLFETNKELEKLSIVAEHTDNAVAIMDGKGNYQWINKGFTRMYGFKFYELDNKRDKIGRHANLRMNDLINVWFGDKKPIIYESLNKCKDGSELWVQTVLTPILDDKGNVKKLITIDTDISKLKEAEQKIEQQRDEISQQRDVAVTQRDEILAQKQEITDSIHYAQRIQTALFPSKNSLNRVFKNSFIFDLPRDIVSGDFFWTYKHKDNALLAVADCTGHGVPGAFMSLIGLNFLNEIVITEGIMQPDKVLNLLREKIIHALRQTDKVGDNKDGMDIALINFDQKTHQLSYAGANNAALIRRGKELIELEPDKMPISIFRDIQLPFRLKQYKVEDGDILYMFTDGYIDQFGGKKGKKFKTHNFKKLLQNLPGSSMEKQESYLHERFNSWKGNLDQVDDILVIGVQL